MVLLCKYQQIAKFSQIYQIHYLTALLYKHTLNVLLCCYMSVWPVYYYMRLPSIKQQPYS